MQMHQIRYFLAVCEERHFTRAAARCAVAQPSLTKAIQRLEAELGSDLFVRGPAGTQLSALGAAVLPHFERIAQSAGAVTRIARSQARLNGIGSATTEVVMQRPHILGSATIALVALTVLLRLTVFAPTVAAVESANTLSTYDLHRSADVAALPMQEVAEPF